MIKTVKSQTIYDGKVIKVYRDEIEQSGKIAVREIVRHGGGACVLAEKDGKFAFVKQYRHALGKEVLEIPAGKRENGEDFIVTAARELEEECALKPEKLKKITEICVSPGYDDEIIGIFYCDTFTPSVQNLDDDEELSVLWLDKFAAYKMVDSGEIYDAKTVVALLWREKEDSAK